MIKTISLVSVLVLMLEGCTSVALNNSANTQVINQETSKIMSELQEGVSMHFDTASSTIDPKYTPYFKMAAYMLEQQPNLLIALEGHTDNIGSVNTNKKISLERANAIKTVLITDYKVNSEQIMTVGLGSARPSYNNNTAEGRANNRRVIATIYAK